MSLTELHATTLTLDYETFSRLPSIEVLSDQPYDPT